MASLCVNIDHIATLRQARGGGQPDPAHAIAIVEMAGSTGVTMHLREDRRHVQDRDVRLARELVKGRLNLEMAATPEMVKIALELRPDLVTLVPERREERTTEGGLEVAGDESRMSEVTQQLRGAGIGVSMFIVPEAVQIEASRRVGASEVEFHTGAYAETRGAQAAHETARIEDAAAVARAAGLIVNAGHGLDYNNVAPIAAIAGMRELNIGHAIVSRAIFSGLKGAVEEMALLIDRATRRPMAYRGGLAE